MVAAHQPAYWPWLGYLHKLASADLFVVMDDLQYESQNFQNRNRIKLNTGPAWITVPLVRGSQQERICDKKINNVSNPRQHWQRRTWRTLCLCYGKSPYFDNYRDVLEDLYTTRWDSLVALDMRILECLREWFQISTPIIRASTLELQGQRTARIVHMCQQVGADAYLSGEGGSRNYLDMNYFDQAGLRVVWQRFSHPIYPQRYNRLGFVSNLSSLDLLLNCGPSSRDILLGNKSRWSAEGTA